MQERYQGCIVKSPDIVKFEVSWVVHLFLGTLTYVLFSRY